MEFKRFLMFFAKPRMKGQVAMEYLLTYGWVMFVLLVALGVVAFMTSNLTSTVKEECLFPQQVLCSAASLIDGTPDRVSVNDVDSLKLNITNNFGHPILLREVWLSYKELGKEIVEKNLGDLLLDDGQSTIVEMNTKGIERGKKYNVKVVIGYSPCGVVEQTSCLDEVLNITGYVYAEAV